MAQDDPWAGFGGGTEATATEDPWGGFGEDSTPPDTSGFDIKPEEPGGVKQRPFLFKGPPSVNPNKPVSVGETARQFAANTGEVIRSGVHRMNTGVGVLAEALIPGLKGTNWNPEEGATSSYGSIAASQGHPVEGVQPVPDFEERAGPVARAVANEGSQIAGGAALYGVGGALAGPGLPALGMGAAMGATDAAGGMYDRVLQETGDHEKAMNAALLSMPGGALTGSLSASAIGRLPGINKITNGLVGDLLLHGGTLGLGAGVQAALDTQIRKRLAGEDLDAWDEIWKAVGHGGLTGLVLRGSGAAGEAVGALTDRATPEAVRRDPLLGTSRVARVEPGQKQPLPELPEGTQPSPGTVLGLHKGVGTVERPAAGLDITKMVSPIGRADLTASETVDRLTEASREGAARQGAAGIERATVAEPKAEPPPELPRESLQRAAQDPDLKAIAQEYEKASERRKLDIREQLQDNLKEFLKPEDIRAIADFEGPVQQEGQPVPATEFERTHTIASQPEVAPEASATPGAVASQPQEAAASVPEGAETGKTGETTGSIPGEGPNGPQTVLLPPRTELDLGSRRAVERPGEPERRTDVQRRKTVGEMTPEERAHALLHSEKAGGMLNERAFQEAEAAPENQGKTRTSIDVDGLGYVNDHMGGHAAGDEYVKRIGEAFQRALPDGAYHLHGDEFMMLSDSPADAEAKLAKVRDELAKVRMEHTEPDGTKIVKEGVGFGYGHGEDTGASDAALYRNKQERLQGGLRSAKGTVPPGVFVEEPGTGERTPLRPGSQPRGTVEGAQEHPTGREATEAAPAEVAPERSREPLPTSTKNAITEQERAMRGEPPLEEALHKEWGESLDNARAAMEKDPALTQRIIEGKPTPELSRDEREAALAAEKVTAHNEFDRVRDAALAEKDNPEAFKALQEQADKISDRLLEIDARTKAEGTESARGLAIRRMMLARDYSIAEVEKNLRLAKGGERLTPEERTQAQDLSRRLIAAEKADAEADAKARDEQTAQVIKQPGKRQRILSYLDAQADMARERLRNKLGRAGGGIPLDPGDIIDLARIAASHIANGIDAGARLIKDFGDMVKPHLDEILAKAQTMYQESPRAAGAEKAAITRATKTAGFLRKKTAEGDFAEPVKREPLPMTPARLKAKTDLEAARKDYEAAKAAFRFKNRTTGQKIRDAALEVANVPKQLITAFDLSATLFQGGFLGATHPVLSMKAFRESVRALASERKSLEVDTALRNRPHAAEGDRAGLELTRLDGPLSQHEEHMRSKWAEKVPGVAASNRAFTTFLNVQRASVFDKMIEALPDKSEKAQNAVANYVNVATGRGYTPQKFRSAISTAANVLWSPRLLISRFQLLAGQPLYRGTASSRTAIAGEYAKALTALGGMYALASLAGADVEKDPRSAAFGKIKSGNTYLDPMLGLSQTIHILTEVATGEKKNQAGEITPLRTPIFGNGRGPHYGQASTADEIFNFLRKKFSPTVGVPLDLATGKNPIGEPVTPADIPKEALVPMSFQDIYKAMKDGGVPEATAIGLISILGAHVEVHEPKK